jgi:hypothetical protein
MTKHEEPAREAVAVPAGWKLVPVEPTRAMKDAVSRKVDDFAREHARLFVSEIWQDMLSASPAPAAGVEAVAYGIIDPDYARVFTVARCIAWSEGYALAMHGSFTRDLDLIAIPWTHRATDAEHLVRRIAGALDDLDILVKRPEEASQATEKPQGRLAWTLTFKAFGDPRFVDLSVMPRTAALASPAEGEP